MAKRQIEPDNFTKYRSDVIPFSSMEAAEKAAAEYLKNNPKDRCDVRDYWQEGIYVHVQLSNGVTGWIVN
jgi:hypothetical protein